MSTPDDLARQMEEAEEILRRLDEKRHPYVEQVGRLMSAVADAGELVNEIGTRWKHDFLERAKAPDKNNPAADDHDDYAAPLVVVAEMLRTQLGFKDMAHRIYSVAVRLTDKHFSDSGTDLHRGALYADLAITYFERKQYELGLSWLLAAANEDVRFNRTPTVYDSFALTVLSATSCI